MPACAEACWDRDLARPKQHEHAPGAIGLTASARLRSSAPPWRVVEGHGGTQPLWSWLLGLAPTNRTIRVGLGEGTSVPASPDRYAASMSLNFREKGALLGERLGVAICDVEFTLAPRHQPISAMAVFS